MSKICPERFNGRSPWKVWPFFSHPPAMASAQEGKGSTMFCEVLQRPTFLLVNFEDLCPVCSGMRGFGLTAFDGLWQERLEDDHIKLGRHSCALFAWWANTAGASDHMLCQQSTSLCTLSAIVAQFRTTCSKSPFPNGLNGWRPWAVQCSTCLERWVDVNSKRLHFPCTKHAIVVTVVIYCSDMFEHSLSMTTMLAIGQLFRLCFFPNACECHTDPLHLSIKSKSTPKPEVIRAAVIPKLPTKSQLHNNYSDYSCQWEVHQCEEKTGKYKRYWEKVV